MSGSRMVITHKIDNKKFLGICIPTYNRRDALKQALEVLIPQVRKYGYPIYISDNSTNAETKLLVEKLSKDYSNIHYHKNLKNVGMGRNMKLALEMANTEYVWMNSDDDMLVENAIEIVRNELLRDNDFIQVNAVGYDKELRKQTTPPAVRATEDMEFNPGDHERFLLNCKNYETYIGGIIIKRTLIMRYLKGADMNNKINQFYVNSAANLRGIIDKKGKYIAKPLIKIRGNNPSYSDVMMDIEYVYYPGLLSSLPKAYSRKTINTVLKRKLTGMLLSVMNTRKLNNNRSFRYYYNYIKDSPGVTTLQKIVVLGFIVMPPQVLEICAALYSKCLKLSVDSRVV